LAVSIAICLPCLFLLVGQVNCCWLAMFIVVGLPCVLLLIDYVYCSWLACVILLFGIVYIC
jgi:hypothetical protein